MGWPEAIKDIGVAFGIALAIWAFCKYGIGNG